MRWGLDAAESIVEEFSQYGGADGILFRVVIETSISPQRNRQGPQKDFVTDVLDFCRPVRIIVKSKLSLLCPLPVLYGEPGGSG